jgi:2-succinyl-5-enolpyruvyl-6-hydroxy-3-cyclohexene-1-carboxylate synthase
LIVVGEGDFDVQAVTAAAHRLRWPILGTASSGARDGAVISTYHHLLVEGVPERLAPETVLTVGRVGPSDRIGALTGLPVPQVHIDPWGTWSDPRRHATHMIQGDPVLTLDAIEPAKDESLVDSWLGADAAMRIALDDMLADEPAPTGPWVARELSRAQFDLLVVASSMPIRDVDAHTVHDGRVVANRGASGIDGFVSTALGVASCGRRTLALAGDLSLLHDAGGWVTDHPGDIVFVVVDNGGGGLFDLLPQAEHAPAFERLFITPHGLDLSRLAAAYGLGASVVDRVPGLAATLAGLAETGGAHVLVVPVDRETDLKQRRALDDRAREVCAGLS